MILGEGTVLRSFVKPRRETVRISPAAGFSFLMEALQRKPGKECSDHPMLLSHPHPIPPSLGEMLIPKGAGPYG